MRIIKFLNWILSIIGILILLNVFGGSLTFGCGLGDLGMIFIFLAIYLIITLINGLSGKFKNISLKKMILVFLFVTSLVTLFYLSMSLTFWRGSEYSWNNEITYPSKRLIEENKSKDDKYKSQIDSVSRLIEKDNKNLDLFISRARLYYQNSYNDNAIGDYLSALKIDKNNFTANLEIGLIYWDKNDLKKALNYNEIALSIDTSYFLAKHRIKMIKEGLNKHSH